MAPKPGKNRFRQSPTLNFSTAAFVFRCCSAWKNIGRVFGQNLEEIGFFGRHQQIAEDSLLRIQLSSGLYGSWNRKYDTNPFLNDSSTLLPIKYS